MKICSKCKENLPRESFGKSKSRYDGLQTYCKTCRKQYEKQWYDNNTNKARQRNNNWASKNKDIVVNYVVAYLKDHPCVDCGESNPVVLEFDHRDRKTKSFNISNSMQGKVSLEIVTEEISKCDVRCANCHRIKTYKENGYSHKD